jgi:hypothetical protein
MENKIWSTGLQLINSRPVPEESLSVSGSVGLWDCLSVGLYLQKTLSLSMSFVSEFMNTLVQILLVTLL